MSGYSYVRTERSQAHRTAAGHVGLLVELLLIRRLPSWQANVGKRLVKAPKVYVRDSGLVHALLGIEDKEGLLAAHPVVGTSWEGFVVENLLTSAPHGVTGYFYRTSVGAEIDLLLVWPNGGLWAVEIKRSLAPRVDRGFQTACADLTPERRFVVYPGEEPYPLGDGIMAMPVEALTCMLEEETSNER